MKLTRLVLVLLLGFGAIKAQAQIPFIGTLAGSGGALDSNGVLAQITTPWGMALSKDSSTIYFTENAAGRIRSVKIGTRRSAYVTGSSRIFNTLTDGVLTSANFNFSRNLVRSANDSIYYTSDFGQQAGNFTNSGIRRVNVLTGAVTTIIGPGSGCGTNGNSGSVTTYGLAITPAGNVDTLYISSECGLLEVIVGPNKASTIVRKLLDPIGTDPNNGVQEVSSIVVRGEDLYFLDIRRNQFRVINRRTNQGRVISTGINSARGLWVGTDTAAFMVENSGGNLVRVNLQSGQRTVIAGGLNDPNGLIVTDTAFFISETNQNRIRMLDRTGRIGGFQPFLGASGIRIDGNSRISTFNQPTDVVLNRGVLYATDNRAGSGAIRTIDTANGQVTTLLDGNRSIRPYGIVAFGDWIYFTENERNSTFRISGFNTVTNSLIRVAGARGISDPITNANVPAGLCIDGDSIGSRLKYPTGLAISSNGNNLYFGGAGGQNEGGNNIRMVDISGRTTTTIAGSYPNLVSGYVDDIGVNARFADPLDVALWQDTVLFVADNGNDRIRKINLTTMRVTTFAGSGTDIRANPRDNVNPLQATIANITSLTLDTANKYLYFTDGNLIRRVSLFGTNEVKTVAGAEALGYRDGLSTSARFASPLGMAFDSTGEKFFLADRDNNRIRRAIGIINTAPSFAKGVDTTVRENLGTFAMNNWATQISAGTKAQEVDQILTFELRVGRPTLFSVQPAINAQGRLTFTTSPNAYGTTNIQVRLKDNGGTDGGGVDTSAWQSFTIKIDSVNSAPVFTLPTASQLITVTSAAGAITRTSWMTGLAQSGSPNLELWQTVSVAIRTKKPQLYNAIPTVTIVGNNAPFAGTLNFTTNPTQAGRDTLEVIVKDNGGTVNSGVDSTKTTFIINITPYTNVAPSFTLSAANQNLVYSSNQTGSTTVNNWATAISRGPAGEASQTLNFTLVSKNPSIYSVAPAVGITGTNGNLTFTLNGVVGKDTLRAVLKDNGGTAFGGVDTLSRTFYITVNAFVNTAPSFTVSAANLNLVRNNTQTTVQTINSWATAVSAGPTSDAAQTLNFIFRPKNTSIYSAIPAATIVGTVSRAGNLTFTLNGTVGNDTCQVVLKDNGGTANGGVDSSTNTLIIRVTNPGSIAEVLQLGKWQLYPNPSTDNLWLKTEKPISKATELELMDATGKTIYSRTIEQGAQLVHVLLPKLPKGFYQAVLRDGSVLYSSKLSIE